MQHVQRVEMRRDHWCGWRQQPGDRQITLDEIHNSEPASETTLSAEEKTILSLLEIKDLTKDELISKSRLPAHLILSRLTGLELKGLIISKPGAKYQKV